MSLIDLMVMFGAIGIIGITAWGLNHKKNLKKK